MKNIKPVELTDSGIAVSGFEGDNLKDEHFLEWEETQQKIDQYFEATEENLENNVWEPHPDQALVRTVPHFNLEGGILHEDPVGRGIEQIWPRYGTVIETGDKISQLLDKGDIVMFNHNFGAQYYAKYLPDGLRLSDADDFDWDDEVRFLRAIEIWGTYQTSVGEDVVVDKPSYDDPLDGVVIKDHPIYSGNIKVDLPDGSQWVNLKYVSKD